MGTAEDRLQILIDLEDWVWNLLDEIPERRIPNPTDARTLLNLKSHLQDDIDIFQEALDKVRVVE